LNTLASTLEHSRLHAFASRLLKARADGRLLLQAGDTGYASAPSNIALLKYWGKQEGLRQVPVNSSLSLTLGSFRAFTELRVVGRFFPIKEGRLHELFEERPPFSLELNGRQALMPAKMERFLRDILDVYAPDISLHVKSFNNFPTACGVASSAAGYAAMVGALADLLNLERFLSHSERAVWLTEWARLGSGSATRSAITAAAPQTMGLGTTSVVCDSQFVAWELLSQENTKQETVEQTTTRLLPYHPKFRDLRHCVLVLDANEKSVSSSEGHGLASTSVLQNIRLAQYPQRFSQMSEALVAGDFACVARLSETDAFEMHAVMGTGAAPLKYMTAQTASALAQFVQHRDREASDMFWTLDAGANPHFLFDPRATSDLAKFFRKLSQTEGFEGARVLMGGKTAAQGLVIGRASDDAGIDGLCAPKTRSALIDCDLISAAERLLL